jgi:hypothetical protein
MQEAVSLSKQYTFLQHSIHSDSGFGQIQRNPKRILMNLKNLFVIIDKIRTASQAGLKTNFRPVCYIIASAGFVDAVVTFQQLDHFYDRGTSEKIRIHMTELQFYGEHNEHLSSTS